MDPRDEALIRRFDKHFRPRERRKYNMVDMDDATWEEGLRLGYRDDNLVTKNQPIEDYEKIIEELGETSARPESLW